MKTIIAFLVIATSPCCNGSIITTTSVATGIVAPGYPGLQPGIAQTTGYVTWQGVSTFVEATASAQSIVSLGTINLTVSTSTENACDCGLGISPYTVAGAHASGSFDDSITLFGGAGVASLTWSTLSSGLPAAYSLPTHVVFGVPFSISASAAVDIDPVAHVIVDRHVTSYFNISGLLVNGSGGYSYSDGSDGALPVNGTFVHAPESGTWVLMVLGALLAGIVNRSKPLDTPVR